MSSILSGLGDVAKKIASLPLALVDALGLDDLFKGVTTILSEVPSDVADALGLTSLFDGVKAVIGAVKDKVSEVVSGITNLPELILNKFKGLFIPDDGYIESKIEFLRSKFASVGVTMYDMSTVMGSETPLEDITCKILGHEVVIVNMDVVDDVVAKFRPVIRGFMYLMMCIYNVNQMLGLIGQQGLTLGGIISTVSRKGDGNDT